MKSYKITSVLVLGAILSFGLLGAQSVSAQQREESNVYQEGVENWPLSEEDRERFIELADNARRELRAALAQAVLMPASDGVEYLKNVFLTLLPRSSSKSARSELLMRSALRGALDIVNSSPLIPSLCSFMILIQSGELGARYYQDDREAVVTGSLLKLPLAEFARKRIQLLTEWARCSLIPISEYHVWLLGLKQWQNSINSPDNLLVYADPEALLKNDDLLKRIRPLRENEGLNEANWTLRDHSRWLEARK